MSQPKDDDTFAQYVADKKNISLASSKYFVEKFITKLREDASHSRYLFADLGSFQADAGQLVFKPNEKIAADPAFYGYPAVDVFNPAKPVPSEVKRQPLAPDQPVTTTPAAPATPDPVGPGAHGRVRPRTGCSGEPCGPRRVGRSRTRQGHTRQ